MSDNRKYYYLKLKENYFDEDAIVLLESMQDGILYSNILLKLYLKSLKNGGKLQLDENIPYTAQMIATITRQQVGTVERALQIFMKLGLVEPLPSGALYRSGKPLIVTTNLTLDDLRNPEDTAHSRIYDRLLSMCVPVRFTGDNFRQETAQRKMESMKKLITD